MGLKDILKDRTCDQNGKMICEACKKEARFFYFNKKGDLVCLECLNKENKEDSK